MGITGLIIAVVLVGIVVAILFTVSGGKRLCPFCHTMMPKKTVKCPHCRKSVSLTY